MTLIGGRFTSAIRTLMNVALSAMVTSLFTGDGDPREHNPPSPAAQIIEHGKFRLHKYQALVGEENYEVTREGDSLVLKSNLNLSYLGTKVSLAALLRAQTDWTPQRFDLKGDT